MDSHKQKYFFLSKRLVFMGSPEGPRALTEEQLTAETQGERAEALTLDDSENHAEANADHPTVSDYMGQVNTKLRSIVSEAGIKDVPTIKAEKSAIDGKYNSLQEKIYSIPSEPLDSHAKAKLAVIHELVDRPEIVAAINEEGSTGESVKGVANNVLARLEKEKDKVKAEYEATMQTDEAGSLVRDRLEKLAIDTIQEKQEARFEQAKLEFISAEIAEVYPDQNEDNVGEKGRCLFAHLQGLLSDAEFAYNPDDYQKSFTNALNGVMNNQLQKNIDAVMGVTTSERQQKAYFGDNYQNMDNEAKAYVAGLLASDESPNERNEEIIARLNGVSPLDLTHVQQALAGYHIEGATDFEKNVGSAEYAATFDSINQHPEIQAIYRQRMVEALRYYDNLPDSPDAIAYRSYFLAQVARLGTDDVNRIESIPSPDLWDNGAETKGVLPGGAKPATDAPRAAVQMAERLADRCKTNGAETGQVFAFTQGNQIYYAKYSGGRNVQLYKVPGGADLSADMPHFIEEGSGDRPMLTPNATVETGRVKPAGAPGGAQKTAAEKVDEGPETTDKQAVVAAVRGVLGKYVGKNIATLKSEEINASHELGTKVLAEINAALATLIIADKYLNKTYSVNNFEVRVNNGKANLLNPAQGDAWAKNAWEKREKQATAVAEALSNEAKANEEPVAATRTAETADIGAFRGQAEALRNGTYTNEGALIAAAEAISVPANVVAKQITKVKIGEQEYSVFVPPHSKSNPTSSRTLRISKLG